MITLIDGYGQLGEALKEAIKEVNEANPDEDVVIYHKWDVWNKEDWQAQAKCLAEFAQFVDKNTSRKIIFISTRSTSDKPYAKAKGMAEEYLLKNASNLVLRLPMLIGKGVFEEFRDGTAEPYGDMDFMPVKEAAEVILKKIDSQGHYPATIYGYELPARIVKELIQFGKHGI